MKPCEDDNCSREAVFPTYDPFLCREHWATFKVWREDQLA